MSNDHDVDLNAGGEHVTGADRGGALIFPLHPRKPAGSAPPEDEPSDHIFIRDRSGLQRIGRNSIITLRADGNYVELHTIGKRFVVRTSLRDVIQQLGERRFPQVNRHTAVNLERLDRVDLDSVEVDGEVIVLSRSYRQGLLDRLRVLSGR